MMLHKLDKLEQEDEDFAKAMKVKDYKSRNKSKREKSEKKVEKKPKTVDGIFKLLSNASKEIKAFNYTCIEFKVIRVM